MSRVAALAQFRAGSSLGRILIGGLLAAISGTFLSMLIGVVAQTLIVRALSVMLYGEYATVAATLGLLSIMLGVGLDTWILHEVSRRPERLTTVVWEVLLLKLAGATVLLILVALAWSARIVNATAFLLGAFGIICDAFAATGYSALRALKRNVMVAVFQTAAALLQLALLGLWQYGGGLDVVLVFGIQAGSSGIAMAALLWFVWHQAGRFAPVGIRLIECVRGSWLLVTSDILATVYSQISLVILGNLVSTQAAGMFRPALNIITYTFVAPSLMFAVGLPILNNAIRTDAFRSIVRLMFVLIGVYSVTVVAFLWLWGDVAIGIIYGGDYAGILPFVQSMTLVTVLKSINMLCVALLIAADRVWLRVAVQLPVALFSVIGGWILIPAYGLEAAIGLTIAIEVLLFSGYASSAWITLRRLRL